MNAEAAPWFPTDALCRELGIDTLLLDVERERSNATASDTVEALKPRLVALRSTASARRENLSSPHTHNPYQQLLIQPRRAEAPPPPLTVDASLSELLHETAHSPAYPTSPADSPSDAAQRRTESPARRSPAAASKTDSDGRRVRCAAPTSIDDAPPAQPPVPPRPLSSSPLPLRPARGASSAAWPSSADLRRTNGLAVSAAPLLGAAAAGAGGRRDGAPALVIPTPKSAALRAAAERDAVAQAKAADAQVKAADAQVRPAASYVAAVVGGARSTVFLSSVPAALVPLPRSRLAASAAAAAAGECARAVAGSSASEPVADGDSPLSPSGESNSHEWSGDAHSGHRSTATTEGREKPAKQPAAASKRSAKKKLRVTDAWTTVRGNEHSRGSNVSAAASGASKKELSVSTACGESSTRGSPSSSGMTVGTATLFAASSFDLPLKEKTARSGAGATAAAAQAERKVRAAGSSSPDAALAADAVVGGRTAESSAGGSGSATNRQGSAADSHTDSEDGVIVEQARASGGAPSQKIKKMRQKQRRRLQAAEDDALLEQLAARAQAPASVDAELSVEAASTTAAASHAAGVVALCAAAADPHEGPARVAAAAAHPSLTLSSVPVFSLGGSLEVLLEPLAAVAVTAPKTVPTAPLPIATGALPAPPPGLQSLLSLLQRGLALKENASAKAVVLQRAVALVTSSVARQAPLLACAVLLEASDCFVDMERSLQCCQRALRTVTSNTEEEVHKQDPEPDQDTAACGQVGPRRELAVLEMLAHLATTRTLARVIDITDARDHLQRATVLALSLKEYAALGWIVLQLGVTLELSGDFSESLAWYAAAEALARATQQPRLRCDVLCCQAIAYFAVGEAALAETAHAAALAVLRTLPRAWHQRPLQNLVQLKLQAGDMTGALQLHEDEWAMARELGDSATAARCLGSIALAKRFLGLYSEAAASYLEELGMQNNPDTRQVVESLTGAASCMRLGGHPQKARDYCVKAVREANTSFEPCTIAKALLEVAEVDLHTHRESYQRSKRLADAREHVVEALEAMQRVDATERRQYLVKATLCELEWRCCSCLQRIALASEPPRVFEALAFTDRCNVPNTVDALALLRRRVRQQGGAVPLGIANARSPSTVVLPASYLSRDVVSETALVRLLRSSMFRARKIVCYSLPWTEESLCVAFVIALSADGEHLDMQSVTLELSEEALCLLVNASALNSVFDAPMETVDALHRRRLYGDTPLWPQHYSKVAFDFEASDGTAAAGGTALQRDPLHCLQLLYRTLVQPLEQHITETNETTPQPVRGLTFVGDGVFSRLPFHAFHDGENFLACRYSTTTCCSLALLCMLFSAYERQQQQQQQQQQAAATPPQDGGAASPAPAPRARVVDVAAVAEDWQLHSVAAQAGAVVEHHTIDGDGTGAASCDEAAPAADDRADEDAEVREVRTLLDRLGRQRKDKTLSNALYTAIHDGTSRAETEKGPACLLELALPAVPEAREEFCGFLTSSDSGVCVSHSFDVAHTWDLHGFALVLCRGFGTFSGLSIHETGIPVYRSLQYAGAVRLMLPVGSRLPSQMRVAVAAARAALRIDSARDDDATEQTGDHRTEAAPTADAPSSQPQCETIADAVRAERMRCIAEGLPLEDWACLTLCGLP